MCKAYVCAKRAVLRPFLAAFRYFENTSRTNYGRVLRLKAPSFATSHGAFYHPLSDRSHSERSCMNAEPGKVLTFFQGSIPLRKGARSAGDWGQTSTIMKSTADGDGLIPRARISRNRKAGRSWRARQFH